VSFANVSYNFNPGLPALFPWASQFANSYDEYVVQSVEFIYEPEQASSSTGAVILSFDYDASDTVPVDKVSALETKDSVRSAPWTPSSLRLNPADLRKRCTEALFTRSGLVASTDIKTFDLGVLNVSTVGQASTATVGELWIEYTIQLRVPQRSSALGEMVVANTSISKTAVFGTAPVYSSGSAVATASGSVVTFQVAGYYLLVFRTTGTVISAGIGATPTVSTGATLTGLVSLAPTADTSGIRIDVVRVLSGSTVTYDLSAATTVTASTLDISPWFSSSVA